MVYAIREKGTSFFLMVVLALSLAWVPDGVFAQNVDVSEIAALGLPVVVIETAGHEEPKCEFVPAPPGCNGDAIVNATKVPGEGYIVMGDSILWQSGKYLGGVSGLTIRIRGNSSAYADKKPYKLKLQREADLVDGNPQYADKEWLLIKNDTISFNTQIGLKVSSLVGMPWTPRSRLVNVIINGDYRGLYTLTENVKRNTRARIDVSSYLPTNQSMNGATLPVAIGVKSIGVLSVGANSFDPLLNGEKTWTVAYNVAAGNVYYSYTEYSLANGGVIDDIQYWDILWCRCTAGGERIEQPSLMAHNQLVGEKDGKLYFCDKNNTSEPTLFMDFSLTKGSCIDFKYSENKEWEEEEENAIHLEVTAVGDTVLAGSTDQRSRRCLHVSYNNSESDVWVEGIGSLKYGISFPFGFRAIGGIPSMYVCRDGEAVLYKLPESPQIINNLIPIASQVAGSTLFDLQGRRLREVPKRGVYIRNGELIMDSGLFH